MATLQSLAFASPLSHSCHQPRSLSVSVVAMTTILKEIGELYGVSMSVVAMTTILNEIGELYGVSSIVTCTVNGSAHSAFNGQSLHMARSRLAPIRRNSKIFRPITVMAKPTIQFIQGTDELTVPDVRLTKSRDGTNGMAIFRFDQPSVFDSSGEIGEITGFYMIDEEGVLQSVDVSAKFVNGKPSGIEAKYVMRTPREWDRFMRFMERYANQNGLEFIKK
ncbi:hypothetical protein EZV62_010899 [Acer yangbiense]|uniref:Photosystem II reaction center Psb28 protein n=1 Tax=Acer yangbiense TaxID=1000413 RepID=A0A5C7I462_9ROSI|nr:hypothetical protein EZV62_010899 [Acer yangbiense]